MEGGGLGLFILDHRCAAGPPGFGLFGLGVFAPPPLEHQWSQLGSGYSRPPLEHQWSQLARLPFEVEEQDLEGHDHLPQVRLILGGVVVVLGIQDVVHSHLGGCVWVCVWEGVRVGVVLGVQGVARGHLGGCVRVKVWVHLRCIRCVLFTHR